MKKLDYKKMVKKKIMNNQSNAVNKQKEFHEWIRNTFDWIDSDAKRLMYRAWCKRGVMDRKEEKNSK